jgi:4-hydroxy-tetrahydrodipicolinate synthase
MGEYRALSELERDEIVGTVLDTVAGRVPVTVGISSDDGATSAHRAARAAALGASSVMSLPPLGYSADEAELTGFYTEIAEASELPVLIYNNPSGAKNDLTPDIIAMLADIPLVAGVKETSGDGRRFAAIAGLTEPPFELVVGIDDLALEGFAAGATGWVTGCGVVAPVESVELFDAVERGDLARARAMYQRLLPLARFDASPKLVQYYKAGLDLVGQVGGVARPPRLALSATERGAVVAALAHLSSTAEVQA